MSRLPQGYVQLTHIRSNGKAYIDTRFKPNSNTTIVMEFQLKNNQCHPFGARTAFLNKAFMLFWTSGSDFAVQIGDKTFNGGTFDETARHTVSMSATSLVIDGETKATYSVDAFQCEQNAWLMSCYSSGDSEYAVGDLFASQIHDGGTLVRDYVPCISPSGEVGAYDCVTGEFYGSSGTEPFGAGDVVEYSLPDGYVELAAIRSTGAEYINSNIKPTNKTRVVFRLSGFPVTKASQCVFGSRTSSSSADKFLFLAVNEGAYRTDFYDNSAMFSASDSVEEELTIDKNRATTTLSNGAAQANTSGEFASSLPIFLFACNQGGNPSLFAVDVAGISCRIYEDDVLVGFFVPCVKDDGSVGMYDLATASFFGNAGSGAFIAEYAEPPAPARPSGLIADIEGTVLTLHWNAVADAQGYFVYKDGHLLGETVSTVYTSDAEAYSRTTYAVSAYNENGEGEAASVEVYLVPEIPVLYLVTDRTEKDVAAGNAKGIYTATDLIRVNMAMDYVQRLLTDMGYACPVTLDTDWTDAEWGTPATMDLYLRNLATVRGALTMDGSTPVVPEGMGATESGKKDGLTHTKANDIEQILVDVYETILLIKKQAVPCGAAECGGAYL